MYIYGYRGNTQFTNVTKLFTLLIILLGLCTSGINSLHCYKCLALDCPEDKLNCEEVREFVLTELRSYYYIDLYLPPCPAVNASLEWRLLQLGKKPCPEIKVGEATCVVGRMQISTEIILDGQKDLIVSHGTVLGCANRILLTKIKNTLKEKHECDMIKLNGTEDSMSHYVSLEHCSQPSDVCFGQDYCVHPKESIVKTFKEQRQDTHFEFGFIIGTIVIILVVIGAGVFASMCRSPLNRASNLPSTDNVDVLSVRATGDVPVIVAHSSRANNPRSSSQSSLHKSFLS